MSASFDPFDGSPLPAAVREAIGAEQAAWEAIVAALRPVVSSLRLVVEAQLRVASYHRGDTLDEVAWIEGRKQALRELLQAVEKAS